MIMIHMINYPAASHRMNVFMSFKHFWFDYGANEKQEAKSPLSLK